MRVLVCGGRDYDDADFVEHVLSGLRPKVINMKALPGGVFPYGHVYIGRAGNGFDGLYGNPFSQGTRAQNIRNFRAVFEARMHGESTGWLKFAKADVLALHSKTLVCFCKPKPCHGDVIAQWLTPTVIIHGDARGADTLADAWAQRHKVAVVSFPANWEKDGRSAGNKRNQQMLDVGRPDLVVAFPGGAGTADMVKRALAAGVEVYQP